MFPERLKTARKERSLSRSQLASVIGATTSAITRWELGMREPRFEMLIKLCDALDVTSDYLLGRTDDDVDVDNEVANPEGQDNTDDDA